MSPLYSVIFFGSSSMEHTILLEKKYIELKKCQQSSRAPLLNPNENRDSVVPAPAGKSSFLHHRKGEEGGKRAPFTSSSSTDFYQIYFPTTHSSLGMKALLFSRDSHSLFSHLAAGTLYLLQLWLLENCFLPKLLRESARHILASTEWHPAFMKTVPLSFRIAKLVAFFLTKHLPLSLI
jgi:hypothetical protein